VNLAIVLVDAELELVPESSRTGPIKVLDAFLHDDLMSNLQDASRRGRGDIVHSALLLCQGSELNRQGRLRVFVHTRDQKVVEVDQNAEVHPNYVRFLKEMGDLLMGGTVPGYAVKQKDLSTLVSDVRADIVIAMSQFGTETSLEDALRRAGNGLALVLIGGFPEGDYISPVYELSDISVSLGSRLMKVPEVAAEVLQAVQDRKTKRG
jgi:rRNA small subunit pseudouridine methyltransferase Nep1